ncbi:two-component system histidine kinase PnpS [Halalkalibacter urbisdiaboli]|uniref:two-component system histidine kinase PnpS n=1 Tax=Halalkalibacter urbisdiaboli TaxID=1960589 RepID=UPI000B44C269|nr:ATP-binding protein [Halalkalibacter urbisdiaboli]
MFKLRIRFIFAVLSITFIVLVSLGIVIGQLYEDFYLDNFTERLKKEAELVAFTLESNGIEESTIQTLTEKISARLDARLTIILEDGTVIGESEVDPTTMDNHYERPELTEVRLGNDGVETRYSTTVGAEMLYYAVPMLNAEGQLFGYARLGLAMTTLDVMKQKIWGIITASFAVGFFIIMIVTYRVTDQMIRPIENVTTIANELAEGNFKARASEGKQDEIGQMTRSMNVLAYNLEQITNRNQAQQERMETLIENMGSGLILINSRGDITLINRTCQHIFQENTDLWLNHLYHDVIKHKEIIKIVQTILLTEDKQRKQIHFPINLEIRHFDVYGAPVISNNGIVKGIVLVFHDITELKKLEQVRKDFVANVSHELKTPVTSIRGFSETLLDGAMEEPELREKFINIIWKESERLQGLIHDLLELSKIEQSYFKLNWQPTDLGEIVSDVFMILSEKSEKKGISLELRAEGNFELDGDPERLKQIIINLVNNGIMYTPSGGTVLIQLEETEELIELQVSDTGIGISEQELPRIFERFYRVDRARSRNSGGTGLGLAIVKHLVEAHHGKINVESKIGEGTRFIIQFKRKHEEEWYLS